MGIVVLSTHEYCCYPYNRFLRTSLARMRIICRDLTKIGRRPLPPRCRLPTRSPQFERGGRGGRGGEGGWLRGDGQPSPMPFPCSLRRRVWLEARAADQGPCAPVPTKGLEVGCNMGWCDKWGMRVSQGFAMGGIDPVRVLMKPANHRSTGMRHSPRILPLGHTGALTHVSPLSLKELKKQQALVPPASAPPPAPPAPTKKRCAPCKSNIPRRLPAPTPPW